MPWHWRRRQSCSPGVESRVPDRRLAISGGGPQRSWGKVTGSGEKGPLSHSTETSLGDEGQQKLPLPVGLVGACTGDRA